MKMSNEKKRRSNSLRLRGYDYSQPGAYFVTTVTHQRACLFGEIENGIMWLNDAGKIVRWEWERLTHRFDFVELGAFVVMSNHFHGIIVLQDVGATRLGYLDTVSENENLVTNINLRENHKGSPLQAKRSIPKSLGALIGQFKSRVTKRIHKTDQFSPERIWQRGFHDRIISNEWEWRNIHLYIESNPDNWEDDSENPLNSSRDRV